MKKESFKEALRLIREIEAGAHTFRSRYPFLFKGEKLAPEEFYTAEIARSPRKGGENSF